MDKSNNADVEQALAAAGSRSLNYRTFAEAGRSSTTEPPTKVAAAFPLLAVALPEIADQQVTTAGQTTPAPQIQPVLDDSTTGAGDRTSETIAPTTQTMSVPASETVASLATTARAAISLPAGTASARSPDTPLAGVFRLLRGQTRPPPGADSDVLDKLFRGL